MPFPGFAPPRGFATQTQAEPLVRGKEAKAALTSPAGLLACLLACGRAKGKLDGLRHVSPCKEDAAPGNVLGCKPELLGKAFSLLIGGCVGGLSPLWELQCQARRMAGF